MRPFLIVLQDAQRSFLQFLTFQEKLALSLVCRQARYSVLVYDIWDGMMGLVQRQKQTWTTQEEQEQQSQQVSTRVRSAIRVRSNVNPLALRQPNKPEKPIILVPQQPKKQRFLLMPNKDKMQDFYKTNFKGLGKPKQRLEEMTRVVAGWLQQQGQVLKRVSHRCQQLQELKERRDLIEQYLSRVKDQDSMQFQAIVKRSENQDFSLKSKYEQFISNLQQLSILKDHISAAIQAALAFAELTERFDKQIVLDVRLSLVNEGLNIAGGRANLLKTIFGLLRNSLQSRELRQVSDQVQILEEIKGSLSGLQLSDTEISQAYLKKEVQTLIQFLADLLKYAKFYGKIYLQCQTKKHNQSALEFLKEAGQLEVSCASKDWLQTASKLVSRVRQELKAK